MSRARSDLSVTERRLLLLGSFLLILSFIIDHTVGDNAGGFVGIPAAIMILVVAVRSMFAHR